MNAQRVEVSSTAWLDGWRDIIGGVAREDQKWAGERSICGFSTIFDLKQAAWQAQTCHMPSLVSTESRHGSTSESLINSPQNGQGPLNVNLGSGFTI